MYLARVHVPCALYLVHCALIGIGIGLAHALDWDWDWLPLDWHWIGIGHMLIGLALVMPTNSHWHMIHMYHASLHAFRFRVSCTGTTHPLLDEYVH